LTKELAPLPGEAKGHKRKREKKRGDSVATDETADVAFFFSYGGWCFPKILWKMQGEMSKKV